MAPQRPSTSIFVPKRKAKPSAQPPTDLRSLGKVHQSQLQQRTALRPTFSGDFDDRPFKRAKFAFQEQQPPQLYEGNLDEWCFAIEATLSKHGKYEILLDAQLDSLDVSVRAAIYAGAREVTTWIKQFIRPHILDRIPQHVQSNIYDIIPHLRKIATPFRLMDLPPELRISIFEYVLLRPGRVKLIEGSRAWPARVPALLSVSKQLEVETLPLYYSSNKFVMLLDIDENAIVDLPRVHVMEWAEHHPRALMHLRSLKLVAAQNTYVGGGQVFSNSGNSRKDMDGSVLATSKEVEVTYHPNVGICLGLSPALHTAGWESRKKNLAVHAAVVEAHRKAKGLRGESVALFFRTGLYDHERLLAGAEDHEMGG